MKNNKVIFEIFKFGIVGVLNTFVTQLVYTITAILGCPYLVANATAFIISVFHAYLWQTNFVFKEDSSKEKRVWWKVLLKTYVSYSFTGLFLNSILLIVWIDLLKIEAYVHPITEIVYSLGFTLNDYDMAVIIAPVLNIFINVPINYCLNKFWAYRQNKKVKLA